MSFNNFSFKNMNVIHGVHEVKGFGEGDDVISMEFDADAFVKIVGAKGDVIRVQTADDSCTVTIKLLQISKSNTIFMAQYNIDKKTGAGVLPMVINDKETGETHIIKNAWIMKAPPVIRGAQPNSMDWIIQGDSLISTYVTI